MRPLRPLHRNLARASLALAAFTTLALPAIQAALRFTPLSNVPGNNRSEALGVSADGSTVVGHTSGDTVDPIAFRWTAAAGMTALGDLPGGWDYSQAFAVSADGAVVVGYGHSPGRSIPSGGSTATTWEGFRWTAAGGLAGLGIFPGSYMGGEARAVSADGSVVVGFSAQANVLPLAYRWTQAGGLTSLGTLPGHNQSEARGISSNGSVIVGVSLLNGNSGKAFRWTQAGGMAELGALPGGVVSSLANAISADASTVVGQMAGAVGGDGSTSREAFRWTAAGGYVNLGDLPGGEVRGEALAVSGDGSVVVGTGSGASFAPEAFIWDAANGLRSVRTLLTDAGLASGWSITHATGVSSNGKIIVGHGTNRSGGTQGWILDLDAPPPPPPTVALAWTEDLPQTLPFKSNAVVRVGYDNGAGITDIATQTGANGGFNGVEYADGLLLVPNQGAGTGSRTHASRYTPLLVTNVLAYDLDATPGRVWKTTGSLSQVVGTRPSINATVVNGVLDRAYSDVTSAYFEPFISAAQVVDGTYYWSCPTGSTQGLFKLPPGTSTPVPLVTAASLAIYDLEVVGDYIYFGDITHNAIKRVNTDGTGLVTLVADASFPNGIDVTGDAIYWSEFTSGSIRRSSLSGGDVTDLVTGRNGLRGVAVLPLSLLADPAPQAIYFTGIASPLIYNGAINTPVPLNLAATSGLPVSVELLSGPATLSGSTITYTGPGAVVLRATQAGNASYLPATLEHTIQATPRLAQTITFPQPATQVFSGTTIAFAPVATASSGLPVSFNVVSSTPAGIATRISGTTINLTGVGTVTLRAFQNGSATYAAAPTVDRTFTVSATAPTPPTTAQTITFAKPDAVTYGHAPLALAATATSGLPVAFELVATPASIATLAGSTLTITGAGKVSIKATQPGNGTYKPAAAVTRTLTVNKKPLGVKALDASRMLGAANPAFTLDYTDTDFVNGDTEADLAPGTRPVARTAAKATSGQGRYPITVSGGLDANYLYVAANPAGQLTVLGFGGTYEALLVDGDLTPLGKLTLTVPTNAFSYSGALTLAGEIKAASFKSVATNPLVPADDTFSASVSLLVTIAGTAYDLQLDVHSNGDFAGNLKRDAVAFATLRDGARVAVFSKGQTAPGAGANTLALHSAHNLFTDGPLPLGSGHATAAIAPATGVLTVKGFVADGMPLAATLKPTLTGYHLWANPYGARTHSFVAGRLALEEHPDQIRFKNRSYIPAGLLVWKKAALPETTLAAKQDKSYRDGFGPLGVEVALDPWLPPSAKATPDVPAGTLVQRLGLAAAPAVAAPFAIDYFPTEAAAFTEAQIDVLPASLSLAANGKPVLPVPNPAKFALTLTPGTGAFTGSFLVSDAIPPATTPPPRKVSFSGTLRQAPDGDSVIGTGFFLVPGLAKTDEQPSGEIRLTAP